MSRTKNSARNVVVAALGQILIILTGFIARKIFVMFLDAEYLGVNGLFSSILTVLSLAELGIGTAIIFSLYKPLAENNIPICQALMRIYKMTYIIIGIVVLVVGLGITPFITFFVKEVPESINGIHVIYMMFVVNTAASYFFSYKRSLISASQNQYLIDATHMVMYLIMNALQIAILALTKNYYLFLAIQILSTFTENVILSRKTDRLFPWTKEKTSQELPVEIKQEIIRNVKAMVMHRIGGIVADTTANLLISKFFGLLFLGLYSNYLLVFNSVKSITQTFFNSIKASIGNFGALETSGAAYALYKKVELINFWMTSFCCICICVLIGPFVGDVWLGKEYLLESNVLLILVLNFFLNAMRNTVLTFKEAYGLAWRDRYKPLIAAVVNLGISFLLAMKWGVIGVFLGTTVTHLFVNIWVEGYVVFRYCFDKSLMDFLKDFFLKTVLFVVCGVMTVAAASLAQTGYALADFVIKVLICMVVPNVFLLLCYARTDEFRYLKELGLKMVLRKK